MTDRSRYKSWLGMPKGGEADRCFYPVRLDTYGNGCAHDCVYCYAKNMLDFRNLWNVESPSVANFDDIREMFRVAFETDRKGQKYDNLRRRKPLRLGGLTDPLQPIEQEQAVTFQLLRLLKQYKYPYLLLTKSSLVGTEAYLSVLDPDISYVQISVTTLDQVMSLAVEPMASEPMERFEAMRRVADAGVFVAHRISPLIFPLPDGTLSSGLAENPVLNYFTWDLVRVGCEHGARLTLVEFMRYLPYTLRWARELFPDIGGFDWALTNVSRRTGWAAHYSLSEKRAYASRIKGICDEHGVLFSVCDDGDYEDLKDFWFNSEDCCGVLGVVPGFSQTWKS